MKYPTQLLPKSNYKKIGQLHEGILIRHTSDKDIIDDFGQLKERYITLQTDHLRDYSTNLIGKGKYEIKDIVIKINAKSENGYFVALWKEGTEVKEPVYTKDFELDEQRGYFFLDIEELAEAPVSYKYLDEEINGECVVIHTPVNSNFWHCSIRWILEDGTDLHKLKRKQRRSESRALLAAAKRLISQKAFFNIENYPEIKEKMYLKK